MDLDFIEEDNFQVTEPQTEDAAQSAQPSIQLKPTLLSAVSELLVSFDEKYPTLPSAPSLHPFSLTPPDTEVLENISHMTGVLANCLAGHVTSADPRYVTRMQEYTNHADAWFQVSLSLTRVSCHFAHLNVK